MSFYSYFCLFIFVGFDAQKNMYHTIAKNLFDFQEMDALQTAPNKKLASLPSTEDYVTNHALVCIINKNWSIKEKAMKKKALKPRVPAIK